jgi:DNA polymerase-4
VRGATSLTCSIGVAPCKVVAKIGSDRRKPGGLVVVVPGQEPGFLAPLDVRTLPGVGPKAEERLRTSGVETIGALAVLSDADLKRLLPGSVGRVLRDRARGIDPRGLELATERISISVENTFERDLVDRAQLHVELRGMAREVAEHLQQKGQVARTVTTKLRYADFSIRSRSTSLEVGIDDATQIGDVACRLLDRGLHDRPGALRLVGVGVSGLAAFRQLALET